jgi:outer membrane receptor protein involved in Fe transport
VIVTQHSGDGKANQYFLRGFNLDHGTDFATTVAGLPVNMPTHGHGQGYSDLNFLMPELVQRIEYRKGPYFAKTATSASAGAADIVYRTTLEAPFGQLTPGSNASYRRGVVGGSFCDWAAGLQAAGRHRGDGTTTAPGWCPKRLQRKQRRAHAVSGGDRAQGFSTTLMAYDATGPHRPGAAAR